MPRKLPIGQMVFWLEPHFHALRERELRPGASGEVRNATARLPRLSGRFEKGTLLSIDAKSFCICRATKSGISPAGPNCVKTPVRVKLSSLNLFSLALGGLCLLSGQASARAAQLTPRQGYWHSTTSDARNRRTWVKPARFKAFDLDRNQVRAELRRAPKEGRTRVAQSDFVFELPLPDGSLARFRCVESPIMEPELAAQFPELTTYAGRGIDDPRATVRLDLSPTGLHAQILSPSGAVYIDPLYVGEDTTHVTYRKSDYLKEADGFQCLARAGDAPLASPGVWGGQPPVADGTLRTYRLACAATGEYTAFFGGTVAAGMAAIVTAINRVTGVYEAELGIRLTLVANNHLLVFTDPTTDPYDNNNGGLMLSQNQAALDSIIGAANYDLGHVFSTGGGGIAALGVVGLSGAKARGVTGAAAPKGDAFWIDYVAHEMGHQFGAHHTFNSSLSYCGGNRNPGTAYEPGSGSTIMAYAGICGSDDLQAHSDPYFHSASIEEILAFVRNGHGSACGTRTLITNTAPTVTVGPTYIIPRGTSFTLTASGEDPDGDALTYCWEERDLGDSTGLGSPDNGNGPLFRSFTPTSSPSRTFPRLAAILASSASPGETLPALSRAMNFRVTARDNRTGGGGLGFADTQVLVEGEAGPFAITSPNSAVSLNTSAVVTWSVAGTTNAPINAGSVNLRLSTNGGITFPILLASNVPNVGARTVALPATSNTACRLKIEAVDNIFFAISGASFKITPPPAKTAPYADLVIGQSASTASAAVGDRVVFAIGVTNIGCNAASNAVVVSTFSHPLEFVAASAAQGGWSRQSNVITFRLGRLGPGATALLTVTAQCSAAGMATNTVVVTNASMDPMPADNSASAAVVINPPPPVLAPVPDMYVHAGSLLVITNTTSGSDQAQSLTFGLSQSPPGAAINPVNGRLIWQTSAADANTTNAFLVTATDNGAPTQSDSRRINVIVLPAPRVQSFEVANGKVRLSWGAIPGRRYLLEYATEVTSAHWQSTGQIIEATGQVADASDEPGADPQRFYRIKALP